MQVQKEQSKKGSKSSLSSSKSYSCLQKSSQMFKKKEPKNKCINEIIKDEKKNVDLFKNDFMAINFNSDSYKNDLINNKLCKKEGNPQIQNKDYEQQTKNNEEAASKKICTNLEPSCAQDKESEPECLNNQPGFVRSCEHFYRKEQKPIHDNLNNNNENSDEELFKVFNLEKSLTIGSKKNMQDEINPEISEKIGFSMKEDLKRTLSFIKDSDSSSEENDVFPLITKKLNIKKFIPKESFGNQSLRIIRSNFNRINENSLYSTQDSDPCKNLSLTLDLGSSQKQKDDKYSDEKVNARKSRKSQPVLNQEDFTINLERLKNDRRTTIMIKNIPNRYTREMMLRIINRRYENLFNFFYLPIDFDNNCNVGYAFINFNNTSTIRDFYLEFNNMTWPNFKSDKIAQLRWARIQGKEACVLHFKDSSLMKQNVFLLESRSQTFHKIL